jgi:hypothetical protein
MEPAAMRLLTRVAAGVLAGAWAILGPIVARADHGAVTVVPYLGGSGGSTLSGLGLSLTRPLARTLILEADLGYQKFGTESTYLGHVHLGHRLGSWIAGGFGSYEVSGTRGNAIAGIEARGMAGAFLPSLRVGYEQRDRPGRNGLLATGGIYFPVYGLGGLGGYLTRTNHEEFAQFLAQWRPPSLARRGTAVFLTSSHGIAEAAGRNSVMVGLVLQFNGPPATHVSEDDILPRTLLRDSPSAGAGTSGNGAAAPPPVVIPVPEPQPPTPPGLGGNLPPGQGGTPPGQESPPPGQGGTPPGQETPPPGQGGTPPGQGGTPPGQGGGKGKNK